MGGVIFFFLPFSLLLLLSVPSPSNGGAAETDPIIPSNFLVPRSRELGTKLSSSSPSSSYGTINVRRIARPRRRIIAFASPSIPPPPPISMPVWSLASPLTSTPSPFDDDDDDDDDRQQDVAKSPSPMEQQTSMNIVTFATPVSVAPPKLWIVSLYTNTLTRRAFLDSNVGVLQLLSPRHRTLISILGKRSGYEGGYSKREECRKVNFGWIASNGGNGKRDDEKTREDSFLFERDESGLASLDLLPECVTYIKLQALQFLEAGDHDVALCEVLGTGIWDETHRCVVSASEEDAIRPHDPTTVLYTAQLRAEGII